MPLSVLGFPIVTRVSIDNIEIDASLSETHSYPAELTENPVEDGTPFTDHIIIKPVTLEIDGRISDATQSILAFRGPGKAADAFKALVSLQQKKQAFSVVTGINVYTNMMFVDLSVPRDALDGRSIRFTALLQEILVIGDDAQTNRSRIADGVKHTAISSVGKGIVSKLER